MTNPKIWVEVRFDDGVLFDRMEIESADEITEPRWRQAIGSDVVEMVERARELRRS